jgi:hypothetical protein
MILGMVPEANPSDEKGAPFRVYGVFDDFI